MAKIEVDYGYEAPWYYYWATYSGGNKKISIVPKITSADIMVVIG